MVRINYEQAVSLLRSTRGGPANPGIDDARVMLSALGNPQEQTSVVHVAGTNGKGSVCAFVGSILRAAGYRTGVFTSPHLIRINERITVNGEPISDEDFADAVSRAAVAAEHAGVTNPSFFTLLTVAAYDYFTRCKADFTVMETGIGGRLDATNAVEHPVLSVIASIGYDHTELLGRTLQQIATEKAGIIKQNSRVAAYPQAALSVIEETARRQNACLYALGRSETDISIREIAYTSDNTTFSIQTEYFQYRALTLSLLGVYQIQNAALALLAVHALQEAGHLINEDAVREGLLHARWPGRFTMFNGSPTVVLDGAHNPDGAEGFRRSLALYGTGKRIVLLTGMLKTKDCAGVIRILLEGSDGVVCTQPSDANALPAGTLAGMCGAHAHVEVEPDFRKAFARAKEMAGTTGIVAVAGSLYLIGDIYSGRLL